MSSEIRLPTLDDIKKYPWESTATKVEIQTCHKIADCLFEKFRELDGAGDQVGAQVHWFIGRLAFMGVNLRDKDHPFGHAILLRPDDNNKAEEDNNSPLGLVQYLAQNTNIPVLKARFSDILYIYRKDFKAAKQASISYLDAFKLTSIVDWTYEINGLIRGMTLARNFGKSKPPFSSYVQFIGEALENFEKCNDAYILYLLNMLDEHRVGDYAKAAQISEFLGDRLEATQSAQLARKYYDCCI